MGVHPTKYGHGMGGEKGGNPEEGKMASPRTNSKGIRKTLAAGKGDGEKGKRHQKHLNIKFPKNKEKKGKKIWKK